MHPATRTLTTGASDPMASTSLVVGPTVPVRIEPRLTIGPSQSLLVRPRATIVGPVSHDAVRIGPMRTLVQPVEAITVEVPPRPVWDERGWTVDQDRHERIYRGWYQAINRRTRERLRFEGRITERRHRITPYIADPPIEIRRHPKAPCFTVTQAPWFEIHWRRPAASVDDALLYVERVLDEAINA